MAEIIADTRRQLLLDPNIYIKQQKWNKMLHDAGEELNDDQKAQLKKKSEKRFHSKIHFAGRLYPELYKLADMLYIVFQHDDKGGKWFKKLPSNKSDCVHKIGKWIAENRTRVERADIHTHQSNELKALLTDDDYKDRVVLYYLPQKDLISHFFELWGEKDADLFKPTTDDILRLLGIMLTCEETREFIPDILGTRRREKGRHNLDSAAPRAAAAWVVLLTKFIDEEVIVVFPAKWRHEDFIKRINERAEVDDFYAQHGTFNPNNTERMKLPWTKKLLEEVLKVGRGDYETMMVSYIKGTGGGPGAPENFANWKERDESYILKYTPQKTAMLYLTIIFMWDKTHDFPLKPAVGKMDDGHEDEKYGDAGDIVTTPAAGSSGKKSTGRGDSQIAAAIQDLSTQRKAFFETIMGKIDGGTEATSETRSDKQHKLVMQMRETRDSIKDLKNDLDELKAKRKLCEEKYADNNKKKKKKLKKISVEYDNHERMIATLSTTLMQYSKDLAKLNEDDTSKALRYGGDGSDSSDDSDGSEDSSSSSEDSNDNGSSNGGSSKNKNE